MTITIKNISSTIGGLISLVSLGNCCGSGISCSNSNDGVGSNNGGGISIANLVVISPVIGSVVTTIPSSESLITSVGSVTSTAGDGIITSIICSINDGSEISSSTIIIGSDSVVICDGSGSIGSW